MVWENVRSNRFLSFDADLGMAPARALVATVAPDVVVVRYGADAREFVVMDPDDLEWPDPDDELSVGDFAQRHGRAATVLGTSDSGLALSSGATAGTLGGRAAMPAVVLDDDGIVATVLTNLRPLDGSVGTYEALRSRGLAGGWGTGGWDAGDERGGGGGGGGGGGANSGGSAPGPAGDPTAAMALEVRLPDAVRLGDTVPLLVLLEPGPGAAGSVPLSAHDGEVLEILASPTAGFTLVDRPSKRMTVVVDGPSLPVKFDLRADVEGTGTVRLFVFRDGDCVASVTVSANITAEAVAPAEPVPVTMLAPVRVKAVPDLNLLVLKESFRGGLALRYRLTSAGGDVVSDFGPHALDADPSAYVHARFAEIQEIAEGRATWGAAQRTRLERIGADIYEALVPPDLQEVLWSSDRVRTFLVQTEEPWIPWELCRMTVTRDGRTMSRGFLCEVYEMSRWLPDVEPKPTLRASRIGVVAPRDSGLPSTTAEVEMINRLTSLGPAVDRIKATYESVITTLGEHRYDVLHFIGHGRNVVPTDATQSEFSLAGSWRLRPSDISGETRNLGLATPVVFMNACQVAQASMALHGVGGWAAAMTRAGAGAFVGTHWDVRDDLALTFATAFYERLPTGTVAAAARDARLAVRAKGDGDPTWLAYSVHATPDARCSFAAPAP